MLYRSILRPLLFHISPETAHELALKALSFSLRTKAAQSLAARRLLRSPFGDLFRFGRRFTNPVGLAAGFDKNGVALPALAAIGFGFVEVGTVTSCAQAGNPHPRLFRLPEDCALINRAGFNNDGAQAVAERLRTEGGRPSSSCVLGINIGKSRAAAIEDAIADYILSFDQVYALADYIAINVSSPNTPRLRELQRPDHLKDLLDALQRRNREMAHHLARDPLPLLVKISPDLDVEALERIVDVAFQTDLAGIIATNTSTSREGLRTSKRTTEMIGEGGVSGAPLRARSTRIVATLYRLAQGKLTIIGVGGIFNAEDAWEKIAAGASLIQLYTGLIYRGVTISREINDGLAKIARRQGFSALDEAVGHRAAELSALDDYKSAFSSRPS